MTMAMPVSGGSGERGQGIRAQSNILARQSDPSEHALARAPFPGSERGSFAAVWSAQSQTRMIVSLAAPSRPAKVVVLGDDGQCSRCRDGRNPQIVDPHPPTGLGEIDPQPRPRSGRFIIDSRN